MTETRVTLGATSLALGLTLPMRILGLADEVIE
jgi:hypothetical protein